MKHAAIYPGTFDPITNGHIDIIERASKLFEQVIVAVADNKLKQSMLSHAERIALCEQVLAHLPNVSVLGFDGLLVEFAKAQKANVLIRGLRMVSDFEYEFQLATVNKHLAPDLETIFLTPPESFSYISSSLVRELILNNGDIGEFVPAVVKTKLAEMK